MELILVKKKINFLFFSTRNFISYYFHFFCKLCDLLLLCTLYCWCCYLWCFTLHFSRFKFKFKCFSCRISTTTKFLSIWTLSNSLIKLSLIILPSSFFFVQSFGSIDTSMKLLLLSLCFYIFIQYTNADNRSWGKIFLRKKLNSTEHFADQICLPGMTAFKGTVQCSSVCDTYLMSKKEYIKVR